MPSLAAVKNALKNARLGRGRAGIAPGLRGLWPGRGEANGAGIGWSRLWHLVEEEDNHLELGDGREEEGRDRQRNRAQESVAWRGDGKRKGGATCSGLQPWHQPGGGISMVGSGRTGTVIGRVGSSSVAIMVGWRWQRLRRAEVGWQHGLKRLQRADWCVERAAAMGGGTNGGVHSHGRRLQCGTAMAAHMGSKEKEVDGTADGHGHGQKSLAQQRSWRLRHGSMSCSKQRER